MKRCKLTRALGLTLLGTTVMTFSNPVGANAAWKQNSTGWWYTEGNSWATGWRQISGAWYYFDANGYMKTGWVKDSGTWYYMNNSGAMMTGWVNDGSSWYYMNYSGAMQIGWVRCGANWYYMNNSGAMQTGWIQDKGTWYYMNNSGAMKTGLHLEDDKCYFLSNSTGAMITGWYDLTPSERCYFHENGESAKGWTVINGKTYYFEQYEDRFIMARDKGVGEYYVGTDGVKQEGVVAKVANEKEALELVNKHDSDFISNLKNEGMKLGNAYYKPSRGYWLPFNSNFSPEDEEAYTVNVLGKDNLLRYTYIVGRSSRKIYIYNIRNPKVYEIKNNKIVNTLYFFDSNLESEDWR